MTSTHIHYRGLEIVAYVTWYESDGFDWELERMSVIEGSELPSDVQELVLTHWSDEIQEKLYAEARERE